MDIISFHWMRVFVIPVDVYILISLDAFIIYFTDYYLAIYYVRS